MQDIVRGAFDAQSLGIGPCFKQRNLFPNVIVEIDFGEVLGKYILHNLEMICCHTTDLKDRNSFKDVLLWSARAELLLVLLRSTPSRASNGALYVSHRIHYVQLHQPSPMASAS